MNATLTSVLVTSTTLAFEVAPKVNAVGRLPELMNPNSCVQYFLAGEKDHPSLEQYALKVKNVNSKRMNMTTSYYNSLKKNIDEEKNYIFMYEEEVHEG